MKEYVFVAGVWFGIGMCVLVYWVDADNRDLVRVKPVQVVCVYQDSTAHCASGAEIANWMKEKGR